MRKPSVLIVGPGLGGQRSEPIVGPAMTLDSEGSQNAFRAIDNRLSDGIAV